MSTMSTGSGISARLRIDLLAENLLPGLAGIDRDHAVAALEQIFEHEIARPVVLRRDADHRDGLHRVEDAADIVVGVAVVVHSDVADGGFSMSCRARSVLGLELARSWARTLAERSAISASVNRVTMCRAVHVPGFDREAEGTLRLRLVPAVEQPLDQSRIVFHHPGAAPYFSCTGAPSPPSGQEQERAIVFR